MAKGPENRFIAAVHRKLPKDIHREKMHNPFRGGTADVWYSGIRGDRWIEYKWLPRLPKKGTVKPKLEPLQLKWLGGRFKEGRNISVVVGHPGGALVFLSPATWEKGLSPKATITIETLVAWIKSSVGAE